MTVGTRGLAVGAAVATGIQVGAAIVASRAALPDLGATTLALLRYGIGAAMIVPLAVFIAAPRVIVRDIPAIAILGVGQFGILIALLNLALAHLPSGPVALIFATMPIQTVLLAAALGHERLTVRKIIGTCLTTAGVGFALGNSLFSSSAGGWPWIGIAAAFTSALTGAICSIFYRPYLARNSTIRVSALAMLAAVVSLAPFSLVDPPPIGWVYLAAAPWDLVLFIGASSGIGYLTWLYALRHLPATEVTPFLSLSPITAAVVGTALLGEPLTVGLIVGLGLVTTGLWVALKTGSTPCPAPSPRSNCAEHHAREEERWPIG